MRAKLSLLRFVLSFSLMLIVRESGLRAQNFFHGGVSAQTVAQAGIYAPTSGNAIDALALNPAGLTKLNAVTVNSILIAGSPFGSFTNSANDRSPMRHRVEALPVGAVGAPLGSGRFSAAIGIAPDFTSAVHWRYSDSPGTGGAEYGLQSETSEIIGVKGTAGAGFAISSRLSIGAALGLEYNENTLVAPYIFQQNASLKGLKTLLDLHTHGYGWGGSFGVTAQPTAKLALSAAYSSPITVNSHGRATGNMGEQFAVLGIPFQPDFAYDARVGVKMPQSVTAGGRWQATRTTGISFEGDWVNFRTAFNKLPVSLAQGSNSDINGFLGSSSIKDEIPLQWSDQYTGRIALDRVLGEHYQVGGGFVRRSSLVPNGTVTPLTGAIMKNGLSSGIQYNRERLHLAAAYTVNLSQTANVGVSGLQAGEYSNSRLSVGTQAVVLEVSVRLPKKRS